MATDRSIPRQLSSSWVNKIELSNRIILTKSQLATRRLLRTIVFTCHINYYHTLACAAGFFLPIPRMCTHSLRSPRVRPPSQYPVQSLESMMMMMKIIKKRRWDWHLHGILKRARSPFFVCPYILFSPFNPNHHQAFSRSIGE